MDLIADYHTHTIFCHGKGTVEENVQAALSKGLKNVAIADHGPAIFALGVEKPETFLEIKQEIERCKVKYPEIDVLSNAETNVVGLNGELDLPGEILEQLDLTMVGLHPLSVPVSLREGGKLLFNYLGGKYSRRMRKKSRVINTKALTEAVLKNRIDVVTHPGHKMSVDTEELARVCAKRDTAIEINAKHNKWQEDFIRVARKTGVKFVLGSDAHTPLEVGNLEPALQVIEAAGLGPEQVLNVL